MTMSSPRPHHLVMMLVVGCLVVAGCVRDPDPLDAIKRPRTPSSATVAHTAPPAQPPVAAPPAGQALDTSWFRPRTAWSAQMIDVSNIEPMVLPIYRITIHHSGDAEDAVGDPSERLRMIERAHKGKGWAAIGYHFVIARDGTVFEARPLKFQGAHATGDNNIGNIGICLLGNFDSRPIPTAQRVALEATVDRLRKQYNIKRNELFGHRDFKNTDCPGRYAMEWVTAYKGD